MYPLKLKTEIYQAIATFLDAYKRQDTQTLAEQFDIQGEVLEEIDDMLDFIEDKTKLRLFPLEEMDKFEYGSTGLSIFGDLSDDEEGNAFLDFFVAFDKQQLLNRFASYFSGD